MYPIALFAIVHFMGLQMDDVFILKLLPLLISVYITLLLGLSYKKENRFILRFAIRFSKQPLSDAEIAYIKRSSVFWVGVSFVNVLCHSMMLWQSNVYYWTIYSSFGWYGVFALGGMMQFLHRRYVFLKRIDHV